MAPRTRPSKTNSPHVYTDASRSVHTYASGAGVAMERAKNIVHNHTIDQPCDSGCPVNHAWCQGKPVGLYPTSGRRAPRVVGPLAAKKLALPDLAERVVYPTGSNDERTEDAVV